MREERKITLDDIIYHLEDKIKSSEEENDEYDAEYGLYLEYRKYGKRVFKDSSFRLLINRLKRELQQMYDEG